MEKYNDNDDDRYEQEKKIEIPLTSSSSSSYPPEQPAWARPSGQSRTLGQRVANLFGSTPWSHSSRGYTLAPNASSGEPDSNLPMYTAQRDTRFKKLLRKPTHKRLLQLLCLVLILGIPYAVYTSSSSATTSTSTDKTTSPSSSSWNEQSTLHSSNHEPLPDFVDAEISSHSPLDDRQCLSILEGGADAVACHVELAQRKFNDMVSRQSQTYQQAVDRYVQQFQRQPPPGFEDWFHFAKLHNATIIDDYGQLEKDLAPLRKVPSHILRQRVNNVRKVVKHRLYQWEFVNGTAHTDAPAEWEEVQVYKEILQPFVHKLPDFKLLHNLNDPHRVCGPKYGEEDVNDPSAPIAHCSDGSCKELLTLGCPRNTETTSLVSTDRPSVDMCANAEDWSTKHGLFHVYSECYRTTVPMLSLSKVSSFQDITTASWCYGSTHYRLEGDHKDTIPYAQKKASIYWRGSKTGSSPLAQYAFRGHRERLVMLTHQMKSKIAQLTGRTQTGADLTLAAADLDRVSLPNMPTTFTRAQATALSRLQPDSININFVKLHNCEVDPQFCTTWNATIPLSPAVSSNRAFENKFLIDVDGNAMSCRFYRLLDSNSLVFKQTIWVEWHDDRIVPWLHYVPVSTDYEELPILIDYFANNVKGQELGQLIAESGRDWASTALRKIDLSVYTYRQMLELANIIGHD